MIRSCCRSGTCHVCFKSCWIQGVFLPASSATKKHLTSNRHSCRMALQGWRDWFFFFFAGWINRIQECSVSIREFITIKRSHYRMMLICRICIYYIYCTSIDSDSVYIYVIFGSTSLGASKTAHVWQFGKNRKHPEVFFQLLSNYCLAGWYPASSGGMHCTTSQDVELCGLESKVGEIQLFSTKFRLGKARDNSLRYKKKTWPLNGKWPGTQWTFDE